MKRPVNAPLQRPFRLNGAGAPAGPKAKDDLNLISHGESGEMDQPPFSLDFEFC